MEETIAKPSPLKPFPCLLLSHSEGESPPSPLHYPLLDPFNDKVVDHLKLPDKVGGIDNLYVRGNSHGWIIGVEKDGTSIFLINTFPTEDDDDALRLLPPLNTFPDVLEYRPDRLGEEFALRKRARYSDDPRIDDTSNVSSFFIERVVLSSAPTGTGCIAIAIYGEARMLAYCRYGDEKWTSVRGIEGKEEIELGYGDIIFHIDKFYVVDGNRTVYMISTVGSSPLTAVRIATSPSLAAPPGLPWLNTWKLYLVLVDSSSSDDGSNHIFLVVRYVDWADSQSPNEHYKTVQFQILWKLDLDSSNYSKQCWSTNELEHSLDNQILFLGYNDSLSFPSRNFPGCQGGCLYFTDDYGEGHMEENIYFPEECTKAQECGKGFCSELHRVENIVRGSDLGVFSFKDKTIERLHGYKLPQILWPPPIWIMRYDS